MLNMTAVKTIRMSPDKRKVKYIVEKAKNELQDTFGWLISDTVNNAHAEKTILFCQSLKACGDIYDTFQHFLPCKSKVAMYHSKTPQDIKDNVLSDLMSPNGNIHLVIATSALGWELTYPTSKGLLFLECQRTWNPTFKQLEGVEGMVLMFYP